ncbi:MAG TPA: DUF2334 domain-containing protein [Candidatus Dormibacteraeota bacterium]|nr:DUF2334 domain-containing protein [Candidatus Dormibacteraeota bacterium]
MRYVILRDDDTNALTPVACLDRLYRPFLDRGLPVNLATIPDVALDTRMPNGSLEGFLVTRNGQTEQTLPIGLNQKLVAYLLDNPLYHIVQHGLHHEYHEFDQNSAAEIARRLDEGTRRLLNAGFPKPETFVAPYDRFSRAAVKEVASRFPVLSTGWFELGRLPASWWPRYAIKKLSSAPHWKVGETMLLTHPGCLLSCYRPYDRMLDSIKRQVERQDITVLVTHWWEYFRTGQPDEPFIGVLHKTAEYLASAPEVTVISFRDLAEQSGTRVSL